MSQSLCHRSLCIKLFIYLTLVVFAIPSYGQEVLISVTEGTSNTGWSLGWQTFTTSSTEDKTLYSVSLDLANESAFDGSVQLELYAERSDSGCLPGLSSLVATSEPKQITNSTYEFIEFFFTTQPRPILAPNTQYYITLTIDTPTDGNQGIQADFTGTGGGAGNNCGILNHIVKVADSSWIFIDNFENGGTSAWN